MVELDSLHTTLCALNNKTSAKKARFAEWSEWQNDKGHRVATAKLKGLQRGALGTFFEDDAKMLAVLWDNRDLLIEAVELAKSLNRPALPIRGFLIDMTDEQREEAFRACAAYC